MSDIIAKFGQHIDREIPKKPDSARREMLLGYRAYGMKLKYAPDKRLSPARQYLGAVCMDEHVRSFASPENAAMVSVFLPGANALQVEVFSLAGVPVLRGEAQGDEALLDVSSLQRGSYVIRVNGKLSKCFVLK